MCKEMHAKINRSVNNYCKTDVRNSKIGFKTDMTVLTRHINLRSPKLPHEY